MFPWLRPCAYAGSAVSRLRFETLQYRAPEQSTGEVRCEVLRRCTETGGDNGYDLWISVY